MWCCDACLASCMCRVQFNFFFILSASSTAEQDHKPLTIASWAIEIWKEKQKPTDDVVTLQITYLIVIAHFFSRCCVYVASHSLHEETELRVRTNRSRVPTLGLTRDSHVQGFRHVYSLGKRIYHVRWMFQRNTRSVIGCWSSVQQCQPPVDHVTRRRSKIACRPKVPRYLPSG